jgi:hypothetical protein
MESTLSPLAALENTTGSHRRAVGTRLRKLGLFLLLGAVTTAVVAWGCAIGVDVLQAIPQSAASQTGEEQWSVSLWERPGAMYITSDRQFGSSWSPTQATGAPDTTTPGDIVTAWASSTPDGQAEWLLLEYPKSVIPKAIRVHETYNPGAVDKVTVFTDDGREVLAWQGVDPTPVGSGIGVSEIPLKAGFKTDRVKLYLDSPRVTGWNEIDAVELVDENGHGIWATAAKASSWYGDGVPIGGGLVRSGSGWTVLSTPNTITPKELLPYWVGLKNPLSAYSTRQTHAEQRHLDARGWPMLALWGERESSSGVAAQNSNYPIGGMPSGLSKSVFPGPRSGSYPVGSAAYTSSTFIISGSGGTGKLKPFLPLRPIWPGFAIDTLGYGLVLYLLYICVKVPRRFFVEVSRMRRGCCISCGYQLQYDFVRGCPECGWRRNDLPRL